jgi:hypothetical protein
MLPPSLPSESSGPTLGADMREMTKRLRAWADAAEKMEQGVWIKPPDLRKLCDLCDLLADRASHLPEMVEALADRERMRAELMDWEEREAKVCPEDVGFEEWIGVLNKRLLMLAKLAAPTPQFFGPIGAWEAEKLRDDILAAARVRPEPPTRETSNG